MRLLVYILVGLLLIAGLFYLVSWLKNIFPKSELTVDTSRTAVIKEIRSLNRLETAQFTIDKVIEAGSDQDNAFSQILFGDKLLLIAHGQIIAGVDLAKLQDQDVKVSGTTVSMTLPAPEILTSTIDNNQTKVYDRKVGFLTKGNTNLEADARQKALASIEQAACEGKILDQAGENAKKQLTILLTGLGFTSVTVTAPPGTCN